MKAGNVKSIGNNLEIRTSLSTGLSAIVFGLILTSCDLPEQIPRQLPVVTTETASDISATTATSGGHIQTVEGGPYISARGVVWSTTPSPTTDLSTRTEDGSGSGVFKSSVTGLVPSATYYLRAYATNFVGTTYGHEVKFRTLREAPIIDTSPVTEISDSTAMCGGEISADGGATILTRGVIWSTERHITLDMGTRTFDGFGTGVFVSRITGLLPETTYYVRAYATNALTTTLGPEQSFRTVSD